MRNFIVIVFMFYLPNIGFAQTCKDSFIKEIVRNHRKSEKKFDRIGFKNIKKCDILKTSKFNEYKFIHIPVIEGRKVRKLDVNKENFLCNLNCNKIDFNETLVLKDSKFCGIIIDFPTTKKNYKFDNGSPYFVSLEPVVKKILEIDPDFIFSIYHIPNAFFYIDNGILEVLTYLSSNTLFTKIETCSIETFIESLTNDQISSFLQFKKIKAISY